jgi:hypothetical protein
VQLSEEPEFMQAVAERWKHEILNGDFPWFREFLDRIDAKTLVQELTLAGALDSPDLRAALLAGVSTAALQSGARQPEHPGANGSNGSGV